MHFNGSQPTKNSSGYPFGSYTVGIHEGDLEVGNSSSLASSISVLCNSSVVSPIVAGPLFTCTSSSCSGPGLGEGSQACRAQFHATASSIQLGGRVGTFWAPALATPAWAQFLFPASWHLQDRVPFFGLRSQVESDILDGTRKPR